MARRGVTELGHHTSGSKVGVRLRDVSRHNVDDTNLVAVFCEPGRMDAGRAAYVEDSRRRGREVASEHLLGAQQLQLTETR
jgi:hypothetical protein